MIRIVTDSTCDLTPTQAKEKGIEIVPLSILFANEAFKDRVDITPEQFYERLTSSKELPTTSQPSPYDFVEVLEKMDGEDEVIVITLASTLSGTNQSATIAKGIVEEKSVSVVDSMQVTLGLQILVDEAVRLRDAGKSAQEIVEHLETIKNKIRLVAVVDTLEYLHKGGRLSRTSAIAGTLLNIKPIISVQEGKIVVLAKARGSKNSLCEVARQIKAQGMIQEGQRVYIGYTGERENLDEWTEALREQFHFGEVCESAVGATIGTHVGPGARVIVYLAQ